MTFPAPRWDDNVNNLDPDDRQDWIAVLPLGAHEHHGPHLPLETDTLIVEGIVGATLALLPDHIPATFLPVEPVGYSVEHMDGSGTRTLAWDEAVTVRTPYENTVDDFDMVSDGAGGVYFTFVDWVGGWKRVFAGANATRLCVA